MRRLLLAMAPRINPATLAEAFVDRHGVVHPIRQARGYSERLVDLRARERDLTGETSADQQVERQAREYEERQERKRVEEAKRGPIEERLFELRAERDALKQTLKDAPAARYAQLFSQRGDFAESADAFPIDLWRRFSKRRGPPRPGSIIEHRGRKYVKSETVLDDLALEHGYADERAFRDAIERARKNRKRLAHLDGDIRETRAQLAAAKRNPTSAPAAAGADVAEGHPSLWEQIKQWLGLEPAP